MTFTPSEISIAGWLPVACIFAAQWTGDDRLWLLTNSLFTVYHIVFTRIPSQAVCAAGLTIIAAWRCWREYRGNNVR